MPFLILLGLWLFLWVVGAAIVVGLISLASWVVGITFVEATVYFLLGSYITSGVNDAFSEDKK